MNTPIITQNGFVGYNYTCFTKYRVGIAEYKNRLPYCIVYAILKGKSLVRGAAPPPSPEKTGSQPEIWRRAK
jgi:hypothetical protein